MNIRTWVVLTSGERLESVWGDTDHAEMLTVYADMAQLNAGKLPYWEAMTRCDSTEGNERRVVVYVPRENVLYGGVEVQDD